MAACAVNGLITKPDDINTLLVLLNLVATFTVPLVRLLLFPKRIFTRLSFRTQTWLNLIIFFGSFLGQGLLFNHKMTSWDKVLHVISGAVILFIGNEIFSMVLKEGEAVSPLARSFAATGFSYIAIVIWEIFEFFADYYWINSSNQAYNCGIERDPFFTAIFGLGAQNEGQAAVFDTNVDMLCAVAGSIPAVIVLWLKERRSDERC